MPDVHPNVADIYRRKVERLAAALDNPVRIDMPTAWHAQHGKASPNRAHRPRRWRRQHQKETRQENQQAWESPDEGHAGGLLAAPGTATKFAADVELVADFNSRTVGGTVDGFRSLAGAPLPAPSLTLGPTAFSAQGDPFSGDTTSAAVAGGGKWGARWSDGEGWTTGGTFGFAADAGNVAVLGAFTAGPGASADGGNPDDTVATGP